MSTKKHYRVRVIYHAANGYNFVRSLIQTYAAFEDAKESAEAELQRVVKILSGDEALKNMVLVLEAKVEEVSEKCLGEHVYKQGLGIQGWRNCDLNSSANN